MRAMITSDLTELIEKQREYDSASYFVDSMERCLKNGEYRNMSLFPIGEYYGMPRSFPDWTADTCIRFVTSLLVGAQEVKAIKKAELDLLMARFEKV